MIELINSLQKWMGTHMGFANGNYKFKCPFHKGGKETRPSFYVHGVTGVAFCHTCNQGWSYPKLLTDLGVSGRIVSAAIKIMEEAGYGPKKRVHRLPDETCYLPEEITGVFNFAPVYLLDAGFELGVLKSFGVGYDTARNRATFPIRDHLGRLVGVSGRADFGYMLYGEKEYKILTGEKIPYFIKKSNFVWGMDRIYPMYFHGAGEDPIIVCEGFKAAMWCFQMGFKSSVALMGSYLSREQKRILQRLGTPLVLFLDNDDAGQRGTEHAITMLSKDSIDIRIAQYPKHAKQPDDLDEVELHTAIKTAVPHYRRTYA